MADTRLTELQEKQEINDTDLLYVVDQNEENIQDRSKKMQLGNMISRIKAEVREEIDGEGGSSGGLVAYGGGLPYLDTDKNPIVQTLTYTLDTSANRSGSRDAPYTLEEDSIIHNISLTLGIQQYIPQLHESGTIVFSAKLLIPYGDNNENENILFQNTYTFDPKIDWGNNSVDRWERNLSFSDGWPFILKKGTTVKLVLGLTINGTGVNPTLDSTVKIHFEPVVQPEIQYNPEADEQPDGINVKFTNQFPDWGSRIQISLQPSQSLILPIDSLLFQHADPGTASYLQLDGTSIPGDLITNGIQVAAGTYISSESATSFHMFPLLNGNIYDDDNAIVETNITPWELTTRLRNIQIGGEFPFERGTGVPDDFGFGIWGTTSATINIGQFINNDGNKQEITDESQKDVPFNQYAIYCPLKTGQYIFRITMFNSKTKKRQTLFISQNSFGGNKNYVMTLSKAKGEKVDDLRFTIFLARLDS